ncbi:helicase [Saccharothrix sp. ALI-22-I]|uniref:helicase-related protein n=1 Tax=Saccharothrix sp. ALI-22-I TaxID=1933778 RepID=UPI00097C9CF7|nr:helicase-related protein [Saccharothrix sp. ALI-22-I]ONI92396.1 helicase [Saccharothrix sp. ALI-22-I]
MTSFAVGSLVQARGREWVVLPDSSADFLVLRPLGGTEDDIAAVLPELEDVRSASFPKPDPEDLGDFSRASLLRSALRIGFNASAGPFRSLAGLSVDPRPYQYVPLLMAMRQEVVRLLIADDVGIGKTVEAGLIATELLAQGEARGLTVLCSPALAEQWREELSDKFGLRAELVLPSTATRLERTLIGNETVFERYPYTVVSTDFIKSTRRRDEFIRSCPDLVIVDEAHTCIGTDDRTGTARMLRYELLRKLADDRERHLVLVTATPHSGKEEAFRNLLGLLDPELANVHFDDERGRRRLAEHFVQRRRADIRDYLDEETPFPKDRESKEVAYRLSPAYRSLFTSVLEFVREQVRDEAGGVVRQRVRWWSALALLRALASSPRAAAKTLRTRAAAGAADSAEEADELGRATVLDQADDEAIEAADVTPGADAEVEDDDTATRRRLRDFAARATKLEGKDDTKLALLTKTLKGLLADGYSPIVFCRFIDTAEYLAEQLTGKLGRGKSVESVTGTLPPTERIGRIRELTDKPGQHVLIATDCLSEGVNLQEYFNAVVHYDLAWNPTRHEQREGRVDRFGQKPGSIVRAMTVYGADNGIDGIVLDVLLRKHEKIRKATGVSVPVPAETDNLLHALMEGLELRGDSQADQPMLDLGLLPERETLHRDWESAAEREKRSRSRFAQNTIDPQVVGEQVRAVRDALGTRAEIIEFTREALRALGSTVITSEVEVAPAAFTATTAGLPPALREALPIRRAEPLPFHPDLPLPSPKHAVLTRTDPTVQAVARFVLDMALDTTNGEARLRPARRCGVARTKVVAVRTTLLLVRYRFHLVLPSRSGDRPLVAEDAQLLAYRGSPSSSEWLSKSEVDELLAATPDANIPVDQARTFAERAVKRLDDVIPELDRRGEELAEELRASHHAVRRAAGARVRNLKVTVQKPADVLGVYVYLPIADGGASA